MSIISKGEPGGRGVGQEAVERASVFVEPDRQAELIA
jgi:hypothetical protein